VWDIEGRKVVVLKGHTRQVVSAAFSLDGKRIVTASQDETARVWDRDGHEVAVLKGHTTVVSSAAFSPDGKRIVTGSVDGTVRLWEANGPEIAALKGHDTGVYLRVAFSPDGQRIVVVAGSLRGPRVWQSDGREISLFKGSTLLLGPDGNLLSPDGKRLVTALQRRDSIGAGGRWARDREPQGPQRPRMDRSFQR
jgi:WD40 repeat protein